MHAITTAVLLTADRTRVVLDQAQLSRVVSEIQSTDSLSAAPTLSMRLTSAMAAEARDGTGRTFRGRRVLRLVRGTGVSAKTELWRVEGVEESATASSEPTVIFRPMWMDLAGAASLFTSGAVADSVVSLTGRTLQDALQQILSPENGGPVDRTGAQLFVAGTVDPLAANRVSDVQAQAEKVLGVLEQLAQSADVEYRFRIVPGSSVNDDTYAVDLVVPSTETVGTVGIVGNKGDAKNAARLDRSEDVSEIVTAFIPLGSDGGTCAGAVWTVAQANGNTATLALPEAQLGIFTGEAPAIVASAGSLDGHQLQNVTTGDIYDVTASQSPAQVTTSPQTPQGARVRVLRPDGSAASAVRDGVLESEYGRVEDYLQTGIPSQPEILSEAGVSTDMSVWTDGGTGNGFRPLGTSTDGTVILTRVTDPGLVVAGPASMRAQIDAGFGFSGHVQFGAAGALDRREYGEALGVWVAMRVESGVAALVLSDGFAELARITVPQTTGGAAGGAFDVHRFELTPDKLSGIDQALLRLRVESANQSQLTVVVDAVTAVRSTAAQPYAPLAGPRGLWLAAVRALRSQAGTESWSSDVLDASAIGNGSEPIVAGSLVAVQPDGGFATSTARVVEASWTDYLTAGTGGAPTAAQARDTVEVQVRLGRPRPRLQERLVRGIIGAYSETGGTVTQTGSSSGGGGSSSGTTSGSGSASSTVEIKGNAGLSVTPAGAQGLDVPRTWTVTPSGYLTQVSLDNRYLNTAGDTATGLIGFDAGVKVGPGADGGRLVGETFTGDDGVARPAVRVQNPNGSADGTLIASRLVLTSGEIDQYNTNELLVRDQYVALNAGQPAPALNGGLRVVRGSALDAYLFWDESVDRWGTKLGPSGGTSLLLESGQPATITAPWTFTQPVAFPYADGDRLLLLGGSGRAKIAHEAGWKVHHTSGTEDAGGTGYFAWSTRGAGAVLGERMRLTNAGSLLLGTAAESAYRLDVAGTARVQGALALASTVSTVAWTSGLQGWGVTATGNADFRLIQADELRVKAFVADVSQALVGSTILSKSRGVVSTTFAVPAPGQGAALVVDDLETLQDTAVFVAGDTVRMRVVDRSGGGLVVADVWGKVSAYVDLPGGRQQWTFTRAPGSTGSTGTLINKGSVVLDYGVPGGSLQIATVLDVVASGYTQGVRWYDDNGDGVPDRYAVDYRLGDLAGMSRPGLGALAGPGLLTERAYLYRDASNYLRADESGFAIRMAGRDVVTATTTGSGAGAVTTLRLGDGSTDLRLAGSSVRVDGQTTFGSGFGPGDVSAAAASAAVQQVQAGLGPLATASQVEASMLGTTLITGGYLRADLIQTASLFAGAVTVGSLGGAYISLNRPGYGPGEAGVQYALQAGVHSAGTHNPFRVRYDGTVYMDAAVVRGTLQSGTATLTSGTGFYSSASGFRLASQASSGGTTYETLLSSVTRDFRVTNLSTGSVALRMGDFDANVNGYAPQNVYVGGGFQTTGYAYSSGDSVSFNPSGDPGINGTGIKTIYPYAQAGHTLILNFDVYRSGGTPGDKGEIKIELLNTSNTVLASWTGSPVTLPNYATTSVQVVSVLTSALSTAQIRVTAYTTGSGVSSASYTVTPTSSANYDRTESQYGRNGMVIFNSPANVLRATTSGVDFKATNFQVDGLFMRAGASPTVPAGVAGGVLAVGGDGLLYFNAPGGQRYRVSLVAA